MVATDFITAFGRLLRDGKLRDVFAVNPQAAAKQVQLRLADCHVWLQLVPEDVEFQASVLLRKRLDLVKYFVPETSRQLGEKLWPAFYTYARVSWPLEGSSRISDSFHFCQHLNQYQPKAVVASEWNRLAFAISKRKATLHVVKIQTSKGRMRRGLQFLYHGRDECWREFFIYLGL